MLSMTIERIAEAVGGKLVAPAGVQAASGAATAMVDRATTDSRDAGPGSVFVAIAGEHVDGHDFVAKAGQAGCPLAFVDHEVVDAPLFQLVVENTVVALGALARLNIDLRRSLGTPFTVAAITGSVGKTTTKDLTAAVLGAHAATVAPVGSFNNDIGLPLTALKVDEGTRYLVAEMGANHMGELANLSRIVPPDSALELKVGVAHLGEFGSVENIFKAKSELVEALRPDGLAILNADDPHVGAMRDLTAAPVRWFSASGHTQGFERPDEPMLVASHVEVDAADRASFTMTLRQGGNESCAQVRLGIPGAHNVANALGAASIALSVGLELDDVADALGRVRSISPHRMAVGEVSRGDVRFELIDDSFNANPDSTKSGLDALGAWNRPHRIAVLGAMLELGDEASELHRRIGAYAAGVHADALVAVGKDGDDELDGLAASIAQGAREAGMDRVALVDNTADADEAVRGFVSAWPRDTAVVLLKGSHASGLSALADLWNEGKEQ